MAGEARPFRVYKWSKDLKIKKRDRYEVPKRSKVETLFTQGVKLDRKGS